MYKIAVLGDKDSILAFKALGVDVFTPLETAEIKRTIEELVVQKYGVIFITEQMAERIPETITKYEKELLPSIVLIPNNQGSLGIGLEKINSNMEKAIGSNIL